MRADILVTLSLLAALGCGSSQATIGSSVNEHVAVAPAPDDAATPASGGMGAAGGGGPSAGSPQAAAPEPEELPPDPALVKALVAKTGESVAVDNPLHLRLEVTPRPAGEQWLVAVVNRGTEPLLVGFDLNHLSLELAPAEDPKKPRRKWQKPPAPIMCTLPAGFGGAFGGDEPARLLKPGEGLLRRFDPRLYCISGNGDSLLATGQTVTTKLGFIPKPPRTVWRQGKKVEVPSAQVAPFVAEPAPAGPPDAAASKASGDTQKPDPEHDPRVKQLVATPFELTKDLLAGEAEEDPSLPLSLRLLRGSDAATERTATALVEIRAKSKRATVYFRRELLSFTVHGPEGIRGCDPQPDDRAPDRQAYSTLNAGQAVSATSLLAELCPNLTFGRPGLYLLTARFDAARDGAEFGLTAFTGRLESRRQAVVRIRSGDLPPLPPPEPLPIHVGE